MINLTHPFALVPVLHQVCASCYQLAAEHSCQLGTLYHGPVQMTKKAMSPSPREEKDRLKLLGREGYIGGPAIFAYTDDGRIGIFRAQRIRELVAEATRRQDARRFREKLVKARREGLTVADLLDQFDDY